MSFWNTIAGRLGAGGVGGGEPVNKTFIEPSKGGDGAAYFMKVKISKLDYNDKLLVDVNGIRHRVCNLKSNLEWEKRNTTSIGRIGINFNLPETREYGNRFYSLNPFKIGKKDENVFTELVDITGFKTGVSLHNSKVTHENKPLKVLYTNNDNESNMNYIQSIEKESFGCGNYTGIFDSSNDTSYIYVLLQAAGGGGGGGNGQTVGAGGIHGRNTIYLDNEGILTKICIVDGGDGGSGGSAGKSVATSGIWKETITTSLFDSEFSASQEFGTPGELVGVDDKGGSGGASWLGNGGYYFLDDIVVGF